MSEKLYQVDAFTNRPFRGNPAAVLLLSREKNQDWMQQVAMEMGLSETAFLTPLSDQMEFKIQWFTPTTEAELCGHATLAAAHILWEDGLVPSEATIRFSSRSGPLYTKKDGDWIKLDFPAEPPEKVDHPSEILRQEFGDAIRFVGQNRLDYLVELESDKAVLQYQPRFSHLERLGRGLIITAKSGDPLYDFTSRVFAPSEGIPEDPVTGSAHCCLGPYWSNILKKEKLIGYQASKRGGVVRVHQHESRTHLFGQAVTIMRGIIQI